MKAKLIFQHKIIYSDGAIVEVRAWSVAKTSRTPEGIKYSFVYIDPNGSRLLGYDNAHGKGHHRHEGKKEQEFPFVSLEDMVMHFAKEVQDLRRERP